MAKDKKNSKKESKKDVATKAVDYSKLPESISAAIDGQTLIGEYKEFSSGSLGYNINGKVVINGVRCQVSCNIIAIGSKPKK